MGVTSYQPSTNARNELKPEGPAVNMAWDITFAGEKMFVVPGGRWSNFFHYPPYVMIYENGGWTNVLATNPMGVPCEDFISVAVDPADASHYFAASYSSGLYEFRGAEQVNYYHHNNSTIESAFPNTPSEYSYLMLDGLTYDDAGNLWFVNTLGQSSVKILMHDGQWEELSYSAFTPKETLGKLLINNQNKNQKWFPYVPRPTIFGREGISFDSHDGANRKWIGTETSGFTCCRPTAGNDSSLHHGNSLLQSNNAGHRHRNP